MVNDPQNQGKALEKRVMAFAKTLKEALPHPKPRYQLLKRYVDTLGKMVISLEKLVADPKKYQQKLLALPRKLPAKKTLLRYVGLDYPGFGAVEALLEGFNQFCREQASATASPLSWYNTLTLYLQVEVVKASRELEAMGDSSNPHFMRQGQQFSEEDASGTDEDVEHISQEYDKAESLPEKTQNHAEILNWVKMLQATNPPPPKKEQEPATPSTKKEPSPSIAKEPKPEHTPKTTKEETPGHGRGG